MKIIITGGAGFIGSNAAAHYLSKGHTVVLLDDFSRAGSEENLEWLHRQFGEVVLAHRLDICDEDLVRLVFDEHADADNVLHLAAQVAVTTSIQSPREDFEVNALGTLNVLEAMRQSEMKATLLYASTNKVYGDVEYLAKELSNGISESVGLDFRTPYACSKGAADQYVLDYHRVFGLRTIVFRQSCIYGPRQTGSEDQGWIAWFMRASLSGRPITVYGDGTQVRDILYIDDLLDAYDRAFESPRAIGRVYNIGGGPEKARSILSVLGFIMARQNRKAQSPVSFSEGRPGDQRVYISDIRRAQTDLGWIPRTSAIEGLRRTFDWIEHDQVRKKETNA